MALQAAADELYGLPPEQFTAARDDFATRLRQAGERELATAVRGLRRPSVPAWLVNVLVRGRTEDFEELLDIGERLRSAMASGTGTEVRRLTDDRRNAVAALMADLEALAGRPVPAAATEEVRRTLEAATADPAAAAAVRSGRLVRPLHYAGFGELPDLDGAVGLAPTPASPVKRDNRRPGGSAPAKAAERETERAVNQAAGAADDAQRAYERRLVEQADAAARAKAAAEEVAAAAEQLRAAQDRRGRAQEAERNAAAATAAARKAAQAAHGAADTARRQLARLRSEPGRNSRQ